MRGRAFRPVAAFAGLIGLAFAPTVVAQTAAPAAPVKPAMPRPLMPL